jgi:Asp/Glu/hydantoin racemase
LVAEPAVATPASPWPTSSPLARSSFSVVTTLQRSVPAIEDRLKLADLLDRCASIRASRVSTLELDADPQAAIRGIVEEARIAVRTLLGMIEGSSR